MSRILVLGRQRTSREIAFKQEFELGVRDTFEPDVSTLRRYKGVYIELQVWFGGSVFVKAAAEVENLESMQVYHPTANRIEANISHELTDSAAVKVMASLGGRTKDCLLHCPQTGKRSTGPCIDCSDGEYTIQLCCRQ